MIVMTYVPEQEMFAWTHYDTNGIFISVWTVPEGQTNAAHMRSCRDSLPTGNPFFIRLSALHDEDLELSFRILGSLMQGSH